MTRKGDWAKKGRYPQGRHLDNLGKEKLLAKHDQQLKEDMTLLGDGHANVFWFSSSVSLGERSLLQLLMLTTSVS